ncbi:hypothetical protein SFPGR_04840 [Sulfuriferula plumbiphila]|nr:hypothetical protein SFPGR_04840 [Sulfuriferula plumbiphila]
MPVVLIGAGLLVVLPPLFGFPFAESFYPAPDSVRSGSSPIPISIQGCRAKKRPSGGGWR